MITVILGTTLKKTSAEISLIEQNVQKSNSKKWRKSECLVRCSYCLAYWIFIVTILPYLFPCTGRQSYSYKYAHDVAVAIENNLCLRRIRGVPVLPPVGITAPLILQAVFQETFKDQRKRNVTMRAVMCQCWVISIVMRDFRFQRRNRWELHLFCVVAQRLTVISYRRFGTIYRVPS